MMDIGMFVEGDITVNAGELLTVISDRHKLQEQTFTQTQL